MYTKQEFVGVGALAAITFGLVFSLSFAALPALAQTADDYGVANSGNYCPKLSITMQRGARDVSYSGQVSELQKFISDYYDIDPDEMVTGFFGRITQGYVQQFQREQGLPTFGIAGSMTRAAIAKVCTSNTFSGTGQTNPNTTNTTPSTTYTPPTTVTNTKSNLVPDTLKIGYPSSDAAIGVGQKILIVYSVGSNIVASDPAIVERKIVNAGTDTSVSGYIPVSVSGGTYTFDWTPSEAGKYQVVLSISYNNTTYPARSGVITVGNPVTPTPTNTSPSITFSYISSGNVIGSFANLPANSQIRFVNASTGARYDAQSTMVWSGGSGPLSITIPNDLPSGTYYLRATDYYNPNTTIAQSSSFQAGTAQVAPSATLDQSSLSTSSNHPRITGTAHGVKAVGLSIGKNGGKFDGTGTFNMDQYGNWGVTLNNQTYEPGTYQVDVYSDTNVLLISGTLTVTGNPTPPTATIDPSSLSTSSNHPRITGTAHGVSSVGLSISQGGGKFDGTGFFSTDVYGNWGITLNNQTYAPGTYGVDVYSDKNVLLMSGTLVVISN